MRGRFFPYVILAVSFSLSYGAPLKEVIRSFYVTTVAGDGVAGSADGKRARFRWPTGVAVHKGVVYIADYSNNMIRRIDSSGVVSTVTGRTTGGFKDGAAHEALLWGPDNIAVDPYGSIYVADADNFRIRKITPDGVVSTVAGAGRPGYRDGAADRALFGYPTGIAVYGEAVYVADRRTHTVRKIEDGKVSTIAGVGVAGYADGAAAKSRLREPIALSVDSSGVYISDSGNNAIRKIEGGVIKTVAGGKRRGYRDGAGQEAMFFWPTGIAVDSTGVVYVCDSGNNKMRRITPDGVVSTVAGGLVAGRSDGPGFTASFNFPTGIAVDDKQGIFVADSGNNMIRRIRVEGSAVSARPEQ